MPLDLCTTAVLNKTPRFEVDKDKISLYKIFGLFFLIERSPFLRQEREGFWAMVEEASASATASETLTQNTALESQRSNEATITEVARGGTESTCNNESEKASAVSSNDDREKSLEFADELMEKGSKAVKDSDFSEATECFSRALEIRLGFFIFLIVLACLTSHSVCLLINWVFGLSDALNFVVFLNISWILLL